VKHVVQRRTRGHKDERGAILIMAAVGLIIMVIASALSIDIGRQALEKRKDQSVVDLAALDAARDSSTATTRAQQSAQRNGFSLAPGSGHTLTVEVGTVSNGVFQPGAGTDAVRVTATSILNYVFVGGQKTLTATAVAANQGLAGFSVGSSLVTIDTSQSALLNPVIGSMIGGNLNLALVSWQGLANANVTLSALQTQLLAAGLQVGSLDSLMNTNITLAQLYTATANVLTNQGQLAAANTMNVMSLAANSSNHLKLGQLFSIDQGSPGSAMSMAVNAFQLVTGSAEVANGTNFVSVPNVNIAVPNVTNTSLSLQVIQTPTIKFGPVGTIAKNAQIHFTLTPTLNVSLGLLGHLTSSLPVDVTAAAATATLETVTCPTPQSIQIGVDPQPVSETAIGSLQIAPLGIGLPIPVTVNASSTVTGSHSDLTFANPGDFSPPAGTKHGGSNTIGLGSLANGSNVTVSGVPVGTVVSALNPVLGSLDTAVVAPLTKALGLDVGSGDVAALSMQCGVLGLVK
jgi:uncharacterized membrane protein